jgi:hypothetical protein
MKSKKSKKRSYSKQDLDIKKVLVIDASDVDKKYPMIDRKATQAKIDLEKKIKKLLAMDAYNINQIAAMLGVAAEKVKKVKDGN